MINSGQKKAPYITLSGYIYGADLSAAAPRRATARRGIIDAFRDAEGEVNEEGDDTAANNSLHHKPQNTPHDISPCGK
jgi:hypothetical protein